MADFADIIARPAIDAIYVLRVSGLPFLFSTSRIPTRWAAWDGGELAASLGGETYRWRPILRPGESFGAVSTKIEPKGGVGQSGGQDFDLIAVGAQSEGQQSNTLLSLLLASIARSDGAKVASLAADLAANASGAGTSLGLIFNPWTAAAPTVLYLGTETITVASPTVNNTTTLTSTVTRARFGSQAQTHTGVIRDGAAVTGGAMYVADYPLTVVGRVAELWCVPGDWVTEGNEWRFLPYAASLDGPENRVVYAGVVDGVNEDGAVVTLRTSSLDQLIKGSAVAQTPTVTLRTGAERVGRVYIGAHNWWLHLDLEVDGAVNYPIIHISDNAALTAGDTITIGSTNFIAGTHWAIGANLLATYTNITNAINDPARGFSGLHSAIYLGVGVEVRSGLGLSSALTFTTANPGAITATADTLRPQAAQLLLNRRLRRSQNGDGAAPYEDVPEGLYRHAQVGGYISDTLAEILPPPISIKCALGYDADAMPEGGRVSLRATVYPPRYGGGARLVWMTRVGAVESFLRDCGFTELEYEAPEAPGAPNVWRIVATKAPPALRIPLNPLPPPPRLYVDYQDQWTATHLTANGWTDDDGNLIPRYIFIKDVGILQMSSYGLGSDGLSISGIARAPTALGSQNAEEVYIEASDTEPPLIKVQRIVALPNVNAHRMMLYMLLGGSGYGTNDAVWDKGWPGCGLHVPARLVASADWLARALERPEPRDGWVWLPNDDARKVFDEELKATQQQVVSDLGQLRLIAMEVPLEASPLPRHVIGPAQLVTDPQRGFAFDRQPNRCVNVVKVKGGWDARTNKWDLEQLNRQQDSIGTWGEQQAVEVEVRGLSAVGDAEAKGRAIAQRIFGLYARPYALVEVDIAPASAWLWEVGDEVELTHPMIPHPTRPTRGATSMACRIVQKEARYAGGSVKAFVTLTLMSYALSGQRYSLWAPSAQLLYSGTSNTWTVVEAAYGAGIRDLADSDYFQLGDRVKTQRLGATASAPATRTIATRTGSVGSVNLTFSAGLAGSSGQRYVMWYADHDNAGTTDAQRRYAYMSNFGGTLALPAGTAPAFRYR